MDAAWCANPADTAPRSDPQGADRSTAVVQAPKPPGDALEACGLTALDFGNPAVLEPTLVRLLQLRADRFDPLRFRSLQALVQKAQGLSPSVAAAVEQRALLALSEFIAGYLAARKQRVSLVDDLAAGPSQAVAPIMRLISEGHLKAAMHRLERLQRQRGRHRAELAALAEALQPSEPAAGDEATLTLEEELLQQEREAAQRMAGALTGEADPGPDQGASGLPELSAMRSLRDSLMQRNRHRRITQVIENGPANPGPLNPQALIIRSVTLMQERSPDYCNRLLSYLEGLLWLGQIDAQAAPARQKPQAREN
jgi:hypothetical protein